MLILILSLIAGSLFAYLSHENFMLVSVKFGPYLFSNIPLFYVIIGSLVSGLVLSYVINLIHSISNSFVLRGKNNEIKTHKKEVLELTKRVHQLELENKKLKTGSRAESDDPNAL